MPAGLPQLPWYRKINPSETDILDLSISSDTIPRSHLYDLSDSILAQKISQVDGVGQVNTYGGAKPAVRVDVNPNALAHYGISLEAVRSALQSANANTPKGNLEDLSNKGGVFPDNISISLSIDGLVMVLLGGVGTVSGGVVGAAIYRSLSIWVISHTDYSKLVLGALIILLVVLFPKGVVGAFEAWRGARTPPRLVGENP